MNNSSRPYCPDCGPMGVPHWAERLSARIDLSLARVVAPLEFVRQQFRPLAARARLGRMMPALAACVAAARLGTLVPAPDEKTNWRARVVWEEAARRGIAMRELRPFGLARELFFASYAGDTIVFDGVPRPRLAHETSLAWMDNKGVVIKKFRVAGVPVPHGASVSTVRGAEKAFREIDGPVVVKPALGSRSRHTYMHLVDLAAVRRAFLNARQLSPLVVVEEELVGFVFRITLVGGTIAGVIRREPAHVMGDGTHTVRELMHAENLNPHRREPHFHPLPKEEEVAGILATQDLTPDAIPKKGAFVTLHEKMSRSFGGSTTEIEDIHPDNRALFLKIAEVLDDPLVGVDFMIGDMARSWREQKKCGVIECNSLPFIDLHLYPLAGPARNVASNVWDMVFPASATSA